jgi:uncharacterized membrane protein
MLETVRNFAIDHFIIIKAVHIISATFWAFAVIGSYFFYVIPAMREVAKNPSDPEMVRRGHWVLEQFDRVTILQHAAFIGILCTGPLLFLSGVAGFSDGWFAVKMAIILPFFIPGEIYGMWYTHIKSRRMTRNKAADPAAYAAFRKRNDKLLYWGIIPTVVLIPSVLFLALTKPF